MGDARVHTIFEKDSHKMVQGEMVLMRGVQIGTLYKLLERRDINKCVNTIILEVDEISSYLVDLTMIQHQCMGHIGEKGICVMHSKGMVKGLLDCSYEVNFCEHCVYGKQNHVSFPFRA